jgi:hypothetical protein
VRPGSEAVIRARLAELGVDLDAQSLRRLAEAADRLAADTSGLAAWLAARLAQ